ncbi:MAG: chemotaxis-specific protein-glutamate methyltransferase CheB [Promethearchaeota archaeon]
MPTALIAEDSRVTQTVIRKFLEEIGFDIVAEVDNGLDAVKKTQTLHPDLVIMDLIMPKMEGLTALEQIMRTCPTRIILISAYGANYADAAFTALEQGAIDFISKYSGNEYSTTSFKEKLQTKAKIALNAKLVGQRYTSRGINISHSLKRENKPIFQTQQLIVIGASTGGPKVIQDILSNLIPPFPPVIVIQHLPIGFSSAFAERLDRGSRLNVVEAQKNMTLKSSTVYVAPGGNHLVLEEKRNRIQVHLFKGDTINGVMPSLEPTLLSASYYFGKNLTIVILTGMGSDGLAGARYSKSNGAMILAQDEQSSTVYGMPKAVVSEGLADIVANPQGISSCLNARFSARLERRIPRNDN